MEITRLEFKYFQSPWHVFPCCTQFSPPISPLAAFAISSCVFSNSHITRRTVQGEWRGIRLRCSHSSNYCGCRRCPTSPACSRPFGLMMAQMMGLKSKLWPPSSCRIAEKVKDTQLDLNFRSTTSYWVLLLFSCSDVSNSLQPHELQHARLPCPHYLPEFAHTYVHWVGDAIQPSHPLLSPSPPAFSLSQHQCLFQWVDFSHQVTQVLELQHQSFQWIFRVDFLYDWLAWSPSCPRDSQESSPQHHNSKASVLCCSAFLMVQLSHPYMTTGKTIALTRRTFVGKVMSLLFNMLSRFVIAFLPKSKPSIF